MNIKAIHRHTALLVILCMITAMLAGCGNTSASSTASSASTVSETVSAAPAPEQPEAAEEPESIQDTASAVEEVSEAEEIPEVQPLEADENGMVTITDMAGRTVTFPENPMVWNSSPTCEGWLCAIAPEQIIGFASEFTEEQLSYYPAAVADTPVIGGNFGNLRLLLFVDPGTFCLANLLVREFLFFFAHIYTPFSNVVPSLV